MNWRDAFVSSGTCPLQNESSSRTCYAYVHAGEDLVPKPQIQDEESADRVRAGPQSSSGAVLRRVVVPILVRDGKPYQNCSIDAEKGSCIVPPTYHPHPSAFKVSSRYNNKRPLRFSPHTSTLQTQRPPVNRFCVWWDSLRTTRTIHSTAHGFLVIQVIFNY